MCSFFGLTAAGQFSASEFLKKYETKFFEAINPRLSLLRLVRKGVIPEDVVSVINTSTTMDAREVLYHHLTHYASVDALKKYCEEAIDAEGYPKMQSLGRKMMEELQQGGGWSCVLTCVWAHVRVCVCVCVCVCVRVCRCGICTPHVLYVPAYEMGLPLSCGPHPTPPTPHTSHRLYPCLHSFTPPTDGDTLPLLTHSS